MRHNSKFLETSPLEHFYVVVKHFLKSAWLSELLHSVSAVSLPLSSASLSETLDSKESRKEELVSENSEDDEFVSHFE